MIEGNFEKVPRELRDLPIWLKWREEKTDKGKLTKVPYVAEPGFKRRAASNRPWTWRSFEDAVTHAVDANGIGLCFTEDYFGMDLDCCRDPLTGVIAPWALYLIKKFNTYAEISPSGTGVHIEGKLTKALPTGDRKHGGKEDGWEIAIYDKTSPRYFTVTGKVLDAYTEIRTINPDKFFSQFQNREWEEKFGLVEKREEKEEKTNGHLRLESSSEKKFECLMQGKWEGLYQSQSEADSALCWLLADEFHDNAHLIDKVFRTSGLMRPKWDEARPGGSYGSITINHVIEEKQRLVQIKEHQSQSELDGPDGLHLTSMGNAERFLRDYHEDVLWVEGPAINSSGTFYCWDGERWQANNGRAMLCAKETVSNLKRLVSSAIEANQKSDVIKSLVSFWRSCENDHKVGEILSLARWNVVIKQGEFDSDPDLLGVENGVVNLRTGTFREGWRRDLITKQCNAVFDETATCPQWERFLLDTTENNLELFGYLQQCAGISLTGHVKEHLFFIIVGPGGTGKSTFCETIKYVWGDYAVGIDPNSLAASRKTEGGRARPDIARLPGVRLAFANETRKGLQLDAGLIKALTGDDTVQARHLYQAEFDFKPTHKLWLRTNEEPQFDGSDTGMQRRVKKIPFVHEVKIKDVNLPEKLRAEASGILNWAIRGLLAYQKYGLTEPAIVQTETAEYIKSLDILAQFIEEECEIGSFKQPAGDLYQRYRTWIDARGQKAHSSPHFRNALQAKGYRWDATKSGKLWYGIRLNQAG
jgi:putative DNA primase/helicase